MGYKLASFAAVRLIAFATCWTTMSLASWSAESHAVEFDQGYLFVDGQYIQGPYSFQLNDDGISINGKSFSKDYFAVPASSDNTQGHRDRMERGGRMSNRGMFGDGARRSRAFDPMTRLVDQLGNAQIGAIVVQFEHEKPRVLYPNYGGDALLYALAGDAMAESEALARIDVADREIANRLLDEFVPTKEFIARVTTERERREAAGTNGDRAAAANIWVARISYPLTVFAMIIVVLGFGHLLSNRPMQEGDTGLSVKNRSVIVKSLSIIALLSLIDLVWTIAASQAGTMRELNPLGSRLIQDPSSLIFFKLAVTSTSVGILYALRQKPIAHVASWWCCLLLTLLTARWVVFQSMFV